MGGRSCQIGNEFGRIWCKKNLGRTLRMDPHPRKMMRKIGPCMVRKIRGSEKNPIPNMRPTKKVTRVRRILLEGVQDHIVSSLHGKANPYAMWKSLTYLFYSSSGHKKLALKDKLKKIKMEKGDTILKYLTKFFQCRYDLGSVKITIMNEKLVSLALLGLPKSWHSY